LRAIGYVDVMRIPSAIINKYVMTEDNLPKLSQVKKPKVAVDQALLDFVVDNRYSNGTKTMIIDLIIDLDKCVRCDECVRACETNHDGNPRFIRQGPTLDRYMIANACMHCVDPVCMIDCPTGAIHRNEESGNIVINAQTCIGCGTCANNCPYNNIFMVDIKNRAGDDLYDENTLAPIQQATKCDLCIDQDNGPACQRACAHDALKRVDLSDLNNLTEWVGAKK